MDILIRFGFSIEEIKKMMDTNSSINDIPDKTISEIIDILKGFGCNHNQIMNILNTNPFCLTRNVDEIKKTITKYLDIGILNLNILLDSFPLLLNVDYNEIDEIYISKKNNNLNQEKILDYFYYDFYKDI